MLVKTQNNEGTDRHLVECKRTHWLSANYLQCFAEVQQAEPSITLILGHGDRVFIMNEEGQTIDSKRVVLEERCAKCGHVGGGGMIEGGQHSGEPCPECGL